MFEELAKQIDDTAIEIEEKVGPDVGVPWHEGQMDWLGELRDGLKKADEELQKMATEELVRGFKLAGILINKGE